ncbi:DUF1320 domain-containing protein [Undibacterium sp. FT147W]|uniref:DUF1320 domain-containing protein n=1 Tax=Undibacterium rivi TaxID=2828729 RepID=A0ABS5H5K1_9BURK|nr:DUF1320 domain-containing protein [Undibacterium rivi]MBR7793783.1 DUF1320 domain-containing protein [Undibacterium rivi]
MMYCTKNDMITTFGEPELIQVTDRANTGVIDDAVLNTAITTAQAEINIWLEGRYPLPLSSVPEVLRRIAMDITRYYLCGDVNNDHPVARRYAEQTKLLRSISRGQASLGLDSAGVKTTAVDTVQISQGRNDFGDRSRW